MSRQTSTEMTAALDKVAKMRPDYCYQCGKKIEVMCNKGTGICSEICRKKQAGEEIGALESRTAG